MKRFLITFLTCSVALNLLAAYNQQGIAYFYDYKTKKKTPLSGVSINVNGAQPAISGAGGAFTLKFSSLGLGQKISFSKKPSYHGLTVFNKQVVDNWYIVQGRLVLIMCKYEEFELAKNNYYAQGKASVERKFKAKIEALSKEVQRLRKENKDCAEQMQELQDLNEEYERIMNDLRNSADAMARIDQSELDAEMQEILDLYEKGEVDEAMHRANNQNLKEIFNGILERKHYHEHGAEAAANDSILILAKIRTAIDLYKLNGDYDKAGEYLKLLADRMNSAEEEFSYASFCLDQNNFRESEVYYLKALKTYQQLVKEASTVYESGVATTLNSLGTLYWSSQRFEESEKVCKEALEIRQRLANEHPNIYSQDVANTLYNLGVSYYQAQRYEESEGVSKSALEIQKKLVYENPQDNEYEHELAKTLNNLGLIYLFTQRFEDSENAYKHALEINQRLAEIDTQLYEPVLAMTLNNLGNLYWNTQNYKESEKNYAMALEIRRRLVEDNPHAYEPYFAGTLDNLGNVYRSTQRFKESEESMLEALKIRQRLAESNPQAYEPVLAMTQCNLGLLYNDMRRFEESEALMLEAVKTYETLVKTNPQAYEYYLTVTLINLGDIYFNSKQYDKSLPILNKAKALCSRLAEKSTMYSEWIKMLDEMIYNIPQP